MIWEDLGSRSATLHAILVDCITRVGWLFWGLVGFTRLYMIGKSQQTPQLSRRTKFVHALGTCPTNSQPFFFPLEQKNALYLLSTYSIFFTYDTYLLTFT